MNAWFYGPVRPQASVLSGGGLAGILARHVERIAPRITSDRVPEWECAAAPGQFGGEFPPYAALGCCFRRIAGTGVTTCSLWFTRYSIAAIP